jgi:hypothetical protein
MLSKRDRHGTYQCMVDSDPAFDRGAAKEELTALGYDLDALGFRLTSAGGGHPHPPSDRALAEILRVARLHGHKPPMR